jgi:3-oxoacyl-[acyl-carrier protein] reductase
MENSAAHNASNSLQPLGGKVALVTGGSRGIGAAIVERLVRDGAAVAFTYRGGRVAADALAGRLRDGGARVIAIAADSADDAAVRGAVKTAVETFGGLDILVNNAAIAISGKLVDVRVEDLDRILNVNVRGPVVATQEALRVMRDSGRVINIGSVNGGYVPFGGFSLYALTKAALTGFTHGLAHELGERGITINDVQPGPVDTDMNPASGPQAEHLRSLTAVKRYGTAKEIASFVAYLAGPDSGYITGTGLLIDGGFAA